MYGDFAAADERVMARGPRYTRDQIEQLTGELCNQVLTLAHDLFPGGYVAHNRYWPLNHTRNDRRPGSFYIWLKGAKVGGWCEFATDERGGILQLIAYGKGWDSKRDFLKIMDFAQSFIGMDLPAPKNIKTFNDSAKAPPVPRTAEQNAKFIKGLWLRGQSDMRGTLADRYLLEHRGIDLRQLARQPGSSRFDAAARYYTAPGEWHKRPSILNIMINEALEFRALHRTYLEPLTAGKYDSGSKHLSSKKMIGYPKGAFVPLSRGAGDLRLRDALQRGAKCELAISEGYEDGLSAALVRPDLRVWMAGTLGNIGEVPLPDIVTAVHVIAQNDEHPQAVAQFNKALSALSKKARGRPIYMHVPPAGIKDINDWLCANMES